MARIPRIVAGLPKILFASCCIVLVVQIANLHRPRRISAHHPGDFALRTHIFENTCKLPPIGLIDNTISKFVIFKRGPLICQTNETAIKMMTRDEDGNFFFEKPSKIDSEVGCFMQELRGALRPKATKVFKQGKWAIPLDVWFWINADTFYITCAMEGGDPIFKQQFAGLADQNSPSKIIIGKRRTPRGRPYDLRSLSIMMVVLDSTSKTQFFRHMPKTMAQMEKMGFVVLNGYNKVGDNSNVNLLPIIADEIAEARRYPLLAKDGDLEMGRILPYNDSIDPDTINFIWKKMGDAETLLNDDIMHVSRGLMHYPEKYFKRGFSRQPTSHYYRPYYINFYEETKNKWKICYKNRRMPHEFLDIGFNFLKFRQHKRIFGFNFLTSTTHDNPNNVQVIDHYLADRLEAARKDGSLNNTVLLLMGDHGQRVHISAKTFAGNIEERTPLISIYLPEELRRTQKEAVQTLLDNSQRFTSNFDLHETLLDLIEGKLGVERPDARGTSLFLPIPKNRSCVQNNVISTFCLCMEEVVEKAARPDFGSLISSIQQYSNRSKCLEDYVYCEQEYKMLSPNLFALLGRRNKIKVKEDATKNIKRKSLFIEIGCKVRAVFGAEYSATFRVRHTAGSNVYQVTHEPMLVDFFGNVALERDLCRAVL